MIDELDLSRRFLKRSVRGWKLPNITENGHISQELICTCCKGTIGCISPFFQFFLEKFQGLRLQRLQLINRLDTSIC